MQYPLHVVYKIDALYCQASENAKVMFWDETQGRWSDDGISDFSYTKEDSSLSFRTLHLERLALVQDIYSEFPLSGWSVAAVGDEVNLTLEGMNSKVSLSINQEGCCVIDQESKMAPILHIRSIARNILEILALYGYQFIANTTAGSGKTQDIIELMSLAIFSLGSCVIFERSQYNRHLPNTSTAFDFIIAGARKTAYMMLVPYAETSHLMIQAVDGQVTEESTIQYSTSTVRSFFMNSC